jgi:hypothetical protein
VAGEFVRPKNMTVGSNNPSFVMKAAFHLVLLRLRAKVPKMA